MTDVLARLTSSLVGRYRVDRELGAGGMATVYLAHDERHDRDVAIKVLHPDLGAALGADRFLAEIKTTAKLQHPHILPLLDSGAADGLLYYVMPYVRGETLRARLERETQLPVADALRLAREVGDALAEAHAKGIVHRDIKPENILLQPSAQGTHALVADFGIALAVQQAGGARLTQTGLSLGTPQYMAPEQAMGDKAVDHRADQYALAAVTYELLAGEPPHTGPNAQAIVAKVLTEAVRPVASLRSAAPAHVDAALATALEKLPADRFTDVAEFLAALRGDATVVSGRFASHQATQRVTSPPSNTARRRGIITTVVTIAALAGGAGWLLGMRGAGERATTAGDGRVMRFQVTLPDSVQAVLVDPLTGAINADGSELTVGGILPNGASKLVRVRTDRFASTIVNSPLLTIGTPLYSPDGTSLSFTDANGTNLSKLRLDDGSVTGLCTCPIGEGADWGATGFVLGSGNGHRGLSTLGPDGTSPQPLTTAAADTLEQHVFPVWVPGTRDAIFALFRGSLMHDSLAVTSLDDHAVRPLGIEGIHPLGVLYGQLVYVRADGAIMAVQYDAATRAVRGTPVAVHDPVQVPVPYNGNAYVVMNRRGDLMTFEQHSATRIATLERDGSVRDLPFGPKELGGAPALSPDGTRLLLAIGSRAAATVQMYDIPTQTWTRLSTTRWAMDPVWLRDAKTVMYHASDGDGIQVVRQPADGSAAGQVVATVGPGTSFVVPTPDETRVLSGFERMAQVSVVSHPIGQQGMAPLTVEVRVAPVQYPLSFSPDGSKLLISTTESGASGLSLVTMPGATQRVQLSSTGLRGRPLWSRDGSTITYLESTGALVELTLTRSTPTTIASRQVVRSADAKPSLNSVIGRLPDGRLLVQYGIERQSRYRVELNWGSELRAKVAK